MKFPYINKLTSQGISQIRLAVKSSNGELRGYNMLQSENRCILFCGSLGTMKRLVGIFEFLKLRQRATVFKSTLFLCGNIHKSRPIYA